MVDRTVEIRTLKAESQWRMLNNIQKNADTLVTPIKCLRQINTLHHVNTT